MYVTNKLSPENAQRIWRTADLPKERDRAAYLVIQQNGEARKEHFSKRVRQVLELLKRGPVYCASPVRLSDIVHVLRAKRGIEIETEFYAGDKVIGVGDYGVYFLRSDIRKLDDGGAC